MSSEDSNMVEISIRGSGSPFAAAASVVITFPASLGFDFHSSSERSERYLVDRHQALVDLAHRAMTILLGDDPTQVVDEAEAEEE